MGGKARDWVGEVERLLGDRDLDLRMGTPEGAGPEQALAALAKDPCTLWAYIALAEHVQDPRDRAELLSRGASMAEAVLGRNRVSAARGNGPPVTDTPPHELYSGMGPGREYLLLRRCVAMALWEAGDRREAVAEMEAVLRCDPRDGFGSRYELASWYAATGDDAKLASVAWLWFRQPNRAQDFYALALVTWRLTRQAPYANSETRQRMQDAVEANPGAAALLRKPPPAWPKVEGWGPGSREEAVVVAQSLGDGWRGTPGALEELEAARADLRG